MYYTDRYDSWYPTITKPNGETFNHMARPQTRRVSDTKKAKKDKKCVK